RTPRPPRRRRRAPTGCPGRRTARPAPPADRRTHPPPDPRRAQGLGRGRARRGGLGRPRRAGERTLRRPAALPPPVPPVHRRLRLHRHARTGGDRGTPALRPGVPGGARLLPAGARLLPVPPVGRGRRPRHPAARRRPGRGRPGLAPPRPSPPLHGHRVPPLTPSAPTRPASFPC